MHESGGITLCEHPFSPSQSIYDFITFSFKVPECKVLNLVFWVSSLELKLAIPADSYTLWWFVM